MFVPFSGSDLVISLCFFVCDDLLPFVWLEFVCFSLSWVSDSVIFRDAFWVINKAFPLNQALILIRETSVLALVKRLGVCVLLL